MPSIRQAAELLKLLPQPGALDAIRTWKPFSITSFRMMHTLRDMGVAPATIIDAGANIGQFARAAVEVYPSAEVISFEPAPDTAARLRSNLADCPYVTVIESAVGNVDGTLEFFHHDYSVGSSALPIAGMDPSLVEEIRVPVGRLDSLLSIEELKEPILLKLDVQGFELEALRGADETLKCTQYVLLEVGFASSYVGSPTFEDTYDFLRKRGFVLRGPLDMLKNRDGLIYVMDALFEREA